MRSPVSVHDYIEIHRLANRYADAVVHRNGERWSQCWTHDAIWSLGGSHSVEGRAKILEFWYGAMKGMEAVVQQVHSGDAWHESDDTDEAMGRWAVSERFATSSGARGLLLAQYEDSYRRVDGTWLFARRILKTQYRGPANLDGGEFMNTRIGLEAQGAHPDV